MQRQTRVSARTCLKPLTLSLVPSSQTLTPRTVPAMSYARFISRDAVSSSIVSIPNRTRSGLNVILVYSSPLGFCVIYKAGE